MAGIAYHEYLLIDPANTIKWSQNPNAHTHVALRDVLTRHFLANSRHYTSAQEQVFDNIINMLELDRDFDRAFPREVINWNQDAPGLLANLDEAFFSGGLRRFVKLVPDSSVRQHGELGYTQPVQVNGRWTAEIHFDTLEGDAHFPTRLAKRFKILYVICHELIHAVVTIQGCKCLSCFINFLKPTFGEDGHGPAWRQIAKAVGLMLMRKTGIYQYQLSMAIGLDPLGAERQDNVP